MLFTRWRALARARAAAACSLYMYLAAGLQTGGPPSWGTGVSRPRSVRRGAPSGAPTEPASPCLLHFGSNRLDAYSYETTGLWPTRLFRFGPTKTKGAPLGRSACTTCSRATPNRARFSVAGAAHLKKSEQSPERHWDCWTRSPEESSSGKLPTIGKAPSSIGIIFPGFWSVSNRTFDCMARTIDWNGQMGSRLSRTHKVR